MRLHNSETQSPETYNIEYTEPADNYVYYRKHLPFSLQRVSPFYNTLFRECCFASTLQHENSRFASIHAHPYYIRNSWDTIRFAVMWYMPNTIRLIERFKQYPVLWDIELPEYKDRDQKKIALKAIADEFGVDVLEVERKLKGLKTQFARELAKCAAEANYKSSWFGFELLQFLKKSRRPPFNDEMAVISPEAAESNVLKIPDFNMTNDNGLDCASEENGSYVFPEDSAEMMDNTNLFPIKRSSSSINLSRRTRNVYAEYENKPAEDIVGIPRTVAEYNKERDEYAVFGEHVANKLRRINDPHARSVAQYYISTVLFQAETTNYNKNSVFRAPSNFTLFYSVDK